MQDTIDSPDFEEVWSGIAGKLQEIPLVAHNSPFDEVACGLLTKPMTLPIPNISSIVPVACQGACILSWSTTNYRLLLLIVDTI